MAKRKKQENLPVYRIDMHTCMQWCNNNGIKMYPIPDGKGEFWVEIDNNGVITRSPKKYGKMESLQKIWELYCHFFDQNN